MKAIATLVILAALVVVAGGCGGEGDASPPVDATIASAETAAAGDNLLLNGGFEDGEAPWFALESGGAFVVTDEAAHSGEHSALLRMRDAAGSPTGGKVYYLIQEITPDEIPEVLSGYYRVENWRRGSTFQYLQFVVIAAEPVNFPTSASNWQIRYPLTGIDTEPFAIGNAKFKFLGPAEPIEGEWVRFETDVRADFKELWGMAPAGFSKLRLLFEVRWDGRTASDGAAEADVWFDDLYVGPARE